MARPVKWRIIDYVPKVALFAPSGPSVADNPANVLLLEELEALRLKDLLGLEQEECADRMQVSRPTFQRILITAREKVADSLINGKSIRISGGNYAYNICPAVCMTCGRHWQESAERLDADGAQASVCPKCGSTKVECAEECAVREPGRHCRRRGHGAG